MSQIKRYLDEVLTCYLDEHPDATIEEAMEEICGNDDKFKLRKEC